jgi:hypothetical protein
LVCIIRRCACKTRAASICCAERIAAQPSTHFPTAACMLRSAEVSKNSRSWRAELLFRLSQNSCQPPPSNAAVILCRSAKSQRRILADAARSNSTCRARASCSTGVSSSRGPPRGAQQLRACLSTTLCSCACASLVCVMLYCADQRMRRVALTRKPRAGDVDAAAHDAASVRCPAICPLRCRMKLRIESPSPPDSSYSRTKLRLKSKSI